jgi:serine/threonine-protein kinase HipA
MAKFPSSSDEKNTGAWEMVLHELAQACGIYVSEARFQKFSGKHHTFLSKRFDRTDEQKRIHFASAMTLLGLEDGTNYVEGVGYLDLVGFIMQHSADAKIDLEQLWRRMAFNVLVSNTDDHLRNHGFLLTPRGWRLSPAYDMNPNEMGNGLTLNISENSNELDISLALETAHLYQLKRERAERILKEMRREISNWQVVAKKFGIRNGEIEQLKPAFRLVVHA